MKNLECAEFLQCYLPQLRFRWAGFRKVHGQVCKRLNRRIRELGLSGFSPYKGYIEDHPEELQILDSMLQITISRFYRDRGVFDVLCSRILPSTAKNILSHGESALNCWSAGCSSGEEAYTLQILWKARVVPAIHQDLSLRITATDINSDVLKRAQEGCYSESSLRDLPRELIRQAFIESGKVYTIKKLFTENIEFMEQDIRVQSPEGVFHLILCRNLVLTYFEEALQREILVRIFKKLSHGGIFVIGIHESLPSGMPGVIQYDNIPGIYKKVN
jgi:chemotaxis protein methyltransferase CheR